MCIFRRCFCVSLKTGIILVAVLDFIGGIGILGTSMYAHIHSILNSRCNKTSFHGGIVYFIGCVICSVGLIYGALAKDQLILILWLIFRFISFVLLIAMGFAICCPLPRYCEMKDNLYFCVRIEAWTVSMIYLSVAALNTIFWIIVYSRYYEMLDQEDVVKQIPLEEAEENKEHTSNV